MIRKYNIMKKSTRNTGANFIFNIEVKELRCNIKNNILDSQFAEILFASRDL